MIEEVFDTIEKAIDIVDNAVSSQDYSQMSRQINDLFKPKTGERLYRDVQNRYPNSPYRAGHMERNKSSVQKEPPTWARTGAGAPPPTWAQRGPAGRSQAAYQNYRQTARANAQTFTANQQARLKNRQPKPQPLFVEPSKVPGFLLIICGAIGLVSFLPGAAGILIEETDAVARVVGALMGVAAAGCGVMLVNGIRRLKGIKRFKIYKEIIGSKLYADVKDLASAVKKAPEKVVKELRDWVISHNIPQGHFDKGEKTFMASNEVYRQYQDVEQRAAELKAQQDAEDAAYAGLTPEAKAVVKKGQAYIDEIRKANDSIPDPVVTEKLYRMEAIVTRIFTEARQRPELTARLNMLIEYYLPTTDKLLKAYRDMSEQPIQGENIKTAKAEIENSLDTINDAFENLLDSFFEDEAIDLSTDISVMKTVMKQQGLTPADLKAEKPASEDDLWENGPSLAELSEAIKEQEKAMASVKADET